MRGMVIALLLLATMVAAQEYSVEEGGGPGDLGARLEEAAATWNEAAGEAGIEAEIEEVPGAATGFTFADPELLGPDIVSATLVRSGEQGFDVWLHPTNLEEFPQALLHELGLLLGLPASESGVMDPALSQETPEAPAEADLQALAATLARAGGDIDGDGDVDIFDLAALGRLYGQQGVNLAADLDGDGEVDADDVALLREAYSFTEPRPIAPEEATGGQGDEPLDPSGGVTDEPLDPGATGNDEPLDPTGGVTDEPLEGEADAEDASAPDEEEPDPEESPEQGPRRPD